MTATESPVETLQAPPPRIPLAAMKSYWDDEAGEYDALYSGPWSLYENAVVANSLSWLADMDQPEVLDIGCGTGLAYRLIAERSPGIRYTGLDLSGEMLVRLKERHPDVEAIQADMHDLRILGDRRFDAVICTFGSMSCTDNLQEVIHQAGLLLKSNGKLQVSVMNRFSLRRLLRLRTSPYETYQTRNATGASSIPTRCYSRSEVIQFAEASGLHTEWCRSIGVLGGVAEHERFIPIERKLSIALPMLGHTVDALFVK
jgi:ubiquinone/menaquinone biosynthesis C-methylase UbiE